MNYHPFFILDDAGEPVPATMAEWAAWLADTDRVVAYNEIGPWEVSTVFVGDVGSIACRLNPNRRPEPWETLVSGPEGAELSGHKERHSSRAEAEERHRALVEKIRQEGSAT